MRFLFDKQSKVDRTKEDLDLLIDILLSVNTKEKIENLLLGLLTPKEIEEFAQRIRLVQLLKKGVSQHEIAGKLGLGVATVSRGAKEIKMGRFQTV